jgi:hypothetical protein
MYQFENRSRKKEIMSTEESAKWRLNRQVNVSVLIQLALLASLIIGSWLNLQRQLDLLQRDVSMLLQNQNNLQQKLETLWTKSISHEYRLRAIENHSKTAEPN